MGYILLLLLLLSILLLLLPLLLSLPFEGLDFVMS